MKNKQSKTKGKRKKSSDSSEIENKASRVGGSPGGQESSANSLSEILKQSNDVLYSCDPFISDDSVLEELDPNIMLDCSAKVSTEITETDKMATAGVSENPTNAEIMTMLKNMNATINDRMNKIDKKLERLDSVEAKVDKFEKELNSIWTTMRDSQKKLDERLLRVEDRVESSDMASGMLSDKVADMQKMADKARDDMNYMQSQNMRNNLIFSNIPEAIPNENGEIVETRETVEATEIKLREFLMSELKLAKETVDQIRFERVHRIGRKTTSQYSRPIVAKFCYFKDRETVRKESKNLKGTKFFISEQFPRDIAEKRKRLMPKMMEARRNNKQAWISYDTLYVDGRPVSDNRG